MEYPLVKACIDLSAIQKNIQNLKQITNKKTRFMAVVKADGYGHGAVKVAQKALKSGADWLGVARLNEAVELRKAGIKASILIFGYIHPSQIEIINELDLFTTVYGLKMAKALSKEAKLLNKSVKVHLKIDTGMGRVGMIIKSQRKQALKNIEEIINLPGIDLKGIYTHFAAADSKDRSYTQMQIEMFAGLLDDLRQKGITIEICHAANSAGIIEFPKAHFDMVRAGISLYGLYPSWDMDQTKVKLFPAMTLKSIVTAVRKVPERFCVSYGMTYKTKKETKLASVPIGYADGFSRQFSSNSFMLVNGYRAPVVGRVCMDQTMIDVGNIPDVKPGCEVVLMGSQGKEIIGADELANRINTINYEIVSALTARVKKVYSGFGFDSGSGSGSGSG